MMAATSLSDDDFRRVADVRRAVWAAGLQGGVAGVFLASTTWSVLQRSGQLPRGFRGPNNWMLATLGCGALGSFLCATAAGKNSMQRIGDVFRRKEPELSRYQEMTKDNMHDAETRFQRRSEILANSRELNSRYQENAHHHEDHNVDLQEADTHFQRRSEALARYRATHHLISPPPDPAPGDKDPWAAGPKEPGLRL